MEITEAARRAVRRDDCKRLGHTLAIDEAISNNPQESSEGATRVRSASGHRVPHLYCRRCGEVWLIPFGSAPTYDDAIALLHALVPLYSDDLIPPPAPEPGPADVGHGHGHGAPSEPPAPAAEAADHDRGHDLDPRGLIEPA